VRTKAQWEQVEPNPGSPKPAPRTGHICVTYDNKIIMCVFAAPSLFSAWPLLTPRSFGGTDGQYHYNDTWCFDLQARRWTELECIGFIPSPREGHAAALVDDVVYIFGGRGVDGKDLGDLAAFKISRMRWFMFQNMGPQPSGRSGHAMASMGARVFVLGGESFAPSLPEEPNMVHVLDTKHIKYPESNKGAPQGGQAGARKSSNPTTTGPSLTQQQQQQQQPPQQNGMNGRPMSPATAVRPGTAEEQQRQQQQQQRALSPTAMDQARKIKPVNGLAQPPFPKAKRSQDSADPIEGFGSDVATMREKTASPEAASVRARSPPNARAMSPAGQPSLAAAALNVTTSRINGRVSPPNGQMDGYLVGVGMTRSSPVNTAESHDADRDDPAASKKREDWMRAALSRAATAGFLHGDIEGEDIGVSDGPAGESPKDNRAKQLALEFKQFKAHIQVSQSVTASRQPPFWTFIIMCYCRPSS
jgi:hypothetical protein